MREDDNGDNGNGDASGESLNLSVPRLQSEDGAGTYSLPGPRGDSVISQTECSGSAWHLLKRQHINNFCCSYVTEAAGATPRTQKLSANTCLYLRAPPGCGNSLCPQSAEEFTSLGGVHTNNGREVTGRRPGLLTVGEGFPGTCSTHAQRDPQGD